MKAKIKLMHHAKQACFIPRACAKDCTVLALRTAGSVQCNYTCGVNPGSGHSHAGGAFAYTTPPVSVIIIIIIKTLSSS